LFDPPIGPSANTCRASSAELEGLAMLPPFGLAAFGTYGLFHMGIFKAPPVAAGPARPGRCRRSAGAANVRMMSSSQRLAALGFVPPLFAGSLIEAPFDFMSDTLRGMRGIMLDMHRRPEKLMQPWKKRLRFQLESCHRLPPCHRYEDVLYPAPPRLRRLYVAAPVRKILLAHPERDDRDPGRKRYHPLRVLRRRVWDQRLKYLAQLPAGKPAGLFQFSDIFKVKEEIGDMMCIVGGMRNSMLQAGTPEEVRAWTKKALSKKLVKTAASSCPPASVRWKAAYQTWSRFGWTRLKSTALTKSIPQPETRATHLYL
jgi:hypothetical protein